MSGWIGDEEGGFSVEVATDGMVRSWVAEAMAPPRGISPQKFCEKAPLGERLFIIFPGDNVLEYHRIKQYADVKHGIHTICSFDEKLAKERGQDQYFRNVALEFTLKLGGINQLIANSRLGITSMRTRPWLWELMSHIHLQALSPMHPAWLAWSLAWIDDSVSGLLSCGSKLRPGPKWSRTWATC